MTITADTITDEQIRELQTLVPTEDAQSAIRSALSGPWSRGGFNHRLWMTARARCAEILNARTEIQ